MKKLALLIVSLLLVSCANNYPLNANLNLQIIEQTAGVYGPDITADFDGSDNRENPEVAVYQITEGAAVRITNLSPPHILVTERLAGGFRQQGLQQESTSPVKISLEIKELLATVTRPKVLYMTNAVSQIHLTVNNRGRTLTKTYNLESNRESLTKPEITELEELLDTQLSDIVAEILGDINVQKFIKTL